MSRKHDLVIHYIESLPIGTRISVRSVAKEVGVSEGTAYRAIKAAEDDGFVSTIERVGTIRIENRSQYSPEMLTYGEIVKIIDGEVFGGVSGLDRQLNKFIIGAMTEEAMIKYFTSNSLIIVGNRESVQQLALENDVAVLITGGFEASDAVIKMANEYALPVIGTTYDTFAVATIINRSMINQEIKEEIMTVEDIYLPIEETLALQPTDTIGDFNEATNQTGLTRFPVQNNGRLVGVITAKDAISRNEDTLIERVMTKQIVTVQLHMSVATASHKMTWEDIEMLPVVANNRDLLGVLSRQNVMKAIQTQQQQPQLVNTIEDNIVVQLNDCSNMNQLNYHWHTEVQPQMLNNMGTLSYGVLCEMVSYTAIQYLYQETESNYVMERLDLHYFNLLQLGNTLQFSVNIIHRSRRQALVEVNVFHENTAAGKALISCQAIDTL
ncbi:CBS domain-containing protein [Aerococcaceae bacterium DSM 111020]|nr:CBS domain-containing protein [Aerococcaceae bacterium DSM 111020]